MKTYFISIPLLLLGASLSRAQTTFSYGREIPYPTEFKVKQNNSNANNGGNPNARTYLPTVEASGFETRKTGTSNNVQSIAVSGVMHVQRSANGQQIAVLKPNNGTPLKVTTGSVFKWNGHILKALGLKDGQYLVYDMTNKKTYAFNSP